MIDYLVTGGAGFIGSNTVEVLLARGDTVRVLDNFSSGKRENIAPFHGRIELIDGDLRDPGNVRRAVEGVTYVLHMGAVPSVPRSVDDPLTTNEANVTGTLNLLLAARDARVKRLVFSSSSSVYGDVAAASPGRGVHDDAGKRDAVQAARNAAGLPKHEGLKPDPLSPYAASKLIGEHYCRMFFQLYGFETVSLRYFNVFGPRQDPASAYAAVVPKFIECLARGRAPDVHGDGLQTRDFTFVADVVRANLLACVAPNEALGQVFNIACHQQITVLGLFGMIRELVGAKGIEAHHTPPRAGDVRHSFADISRAKAMLGYEPEWSLKDGLAKTVEFFTRGRPSGRAHRPGERAQ